MRCIILALLLLYTARADGAGASSGPEEARIDALLAGLEAYESSVVSVRWRQRGYVPPSPPWRQHDWAPGDHSWRSIDERLFWSLRMRMRFRAAPDAPVEPDVWIQAGDGDWRLTWGASQDTGMITGTDWFFWTGASLWGAALGRCLDFPDPAGGRTASEMMRRGEASYLPATEEAPWPGVLSRNCNPLMLMDVEVRVDPEFGFAPRMISVYRNNDGLLTQRSVVLDYQRIDGLWVPRLFLAASYYADAVPDVDQPVTEGRALDLVAARTLAGLPKSLQREDVRQWVERLQIVGILDRERSIAFGPAGIFDLTLEGQIYNPQIVMVEDLILNRPAEFPELLAIFPAGAEILLGPRLKRGAWEAAEEMFLWLLED